ncbi:COG3014 family protein [Hydrocarboniclastica marina]|uniref:Tetratricopeptide repeat protein n=1 Tax=Hydrocarboniclastica marina TaxID=2259620 RepID=A0A4P7XN00_9ALTE|nr:hypothetical protein [Hydrocarboniclastica marina]MAM00383.1 hypothetical protein [Alteromonadaceae bacterium]QCF27647.1 hypothetical protein soil367_17910 [Hydrocarboniclastica marina]
MHAITCRFLGFVLALALSGCAWQTQNRLERYNSAYNSADFVQAAELAADFGDIGPEATGDGDLLWLLQQATALQAAGKHDKAIARFDTTERYFRMYDEQGAVLEWGGQLLSVLTNDASLAYQGMVYDAIMVNSYKSLNFMAEGQPELARVELNRARDRQRRAADFFAEELVEARREMTRKAERQASASTLQNALGSADKALEREYSTLDEWSVYPAFINPFATYLHGLYLLTQAEAAGDYGLAADALRETRAMVPGLDAVDEDWRWAEALAAGKVRLEELPRTVWVIYENGLGPVREVQRIQLPIFLLNRDGIPFWTGIAYPTLKLRSQAQPALAVQLEGGQTARSEVLVNMDAVIATEFRQRLPMVITRAVTAAVAKAAAQYQVQKEAHPLVALLGLIYQVASTQADTRQWTSLPKTIEVAKLERTGAQSDPDHLVISGLEDQRVALPDNQFTLVWVRQPALATRPAITVIGLGREQTGVREPIGQDEAVQLPAPGSTQSLDQNPDKVPAGGQ